MIKKSFATLLILSHVLQPLCANDMQPNIAPAPERSWSAAIMSKLPLGMLTASTIHHLFFSDRPLLPFVFPLDNKDYQYVHDMVDEIARSMNIKKPKLWILYNHYPDKSINLYTIGLTKNSAGIVISSNAIYGYDNYSIKNPTNNPLYNPTFNNQELRALLTRELVAIKNQPSPPIQYLGAITPFILGHAVNTMSPSQTFIKTSIKTGLGLLAGLIPSMLLQKTRAFKIDTIATQICKDPSALITALEKIEKRNNNNGILFPEGTSVNDIGVCVVNPLLFPLLILNPSNLVDSPYYRPSLAEDMACKIAAIISIPFCLLASLCGGASLALSDIYNGFIKDPCSPSFIKNRVAHLKKIFKNSRNTYNVIK